MSNDIKTNKNIISFIYKLDYIKDTVNHILENGAYSSRNYNAQMTKKSDNYNEKERTLVTLAYHAKKLYGEKLQDELAIQLNNDKDFTEFIKSNAPELYKQLQEIICNVK